ncbi:MAG: hypothetical protein IKZ58_08665 [Selenomonadaceae bacterium]|nr:hypothetical protein [Selenomonadaceae bacterium]
MKNILIGIVFVIILGILFTTFMINQNSKAIDENVKELEPELKIYVTLNLDEQNIYVENNLEKILKMGASYFDIDAETVMNKINQDENLKNVSIELGRSIIARMIMSSENLSEILNETNKKILNEDYDKMLDRLHEIFNILYPSAN